MNNDGLPNDATGDTLRRLRDDGANLSKPHELDFYVAVPSKAAAEHVGNAATQIGFAASISKDDEGPDWTCCCTKLMIPDYSAITDTENMLDSMAKQIGGRIDGWGTVPVA